MSRAPRIDTTLNRVSGAIASLTTVKAEIKDLHSLAYERAKVANEARVAGGERDYALDTHGDPRARNAYRRLNEVMVGYRDDVTGEQVKGVCDILTEVSDDVIRLLREARPGERRSSLPSAMEAEELASLLAAQARRAKRGEYSAVAYMPQPEADAALKSVDQLRGKVSEQQQTIDRYEKLLRQYGWKPAGERQRGWRKKPRSA